MWVRKVTFYSSISKQLLNGHYITARAAGCSVGKGRFPRAIAALLFLTVFSLTIGVRLIEPSNNNIPTNDTPLMTTCNLQYGFQFSEHDHLCVLQDIVVRASYNFTTVISLGCAMLQSLKPTAKRSFKCTKSWAK